MMGPLEEVTFQNLGISSSVSKCRTGFNATLSSGFGWEGPEQGLEDAVFELTPFGFGS
jgi:hypothetical protein